MVLTWALAPITPEFAVSAASIAANTQASIYRTDEPIRFYIPARSGMKYWITSTFTGEVFMPRVAVLDETDERIAVILPNEPCTSPAFGTAAAEAVP